MGTDPPSTENDHPLDTREEPVSVVLAELTGRPPDVFKVDDDAEFPDLDELEMVPEAER